MIEHGGSLFVIQRPGLMCVLGLGRCGNAEYGEQGKERACNNVWFCIPALARLRLFFNHKSSK